MVGDAGTVLHILRGWRWWILCGETIGIIMTMSGEGWADFGQRHNLRAIFAPLFSSLAGPHTIPIRFRKDDSGPAFFTNGVGLFRQGLPYAQGLVPAHHV